MIKYAVSEIEINDEPRYGIILEDFPETTFVIGQCEFIEVDDACKLVYNYDVVTGPEPVDQQKFTTQIGDLLIQMLEESIEDKSKPLVFTGGV